MHIWRTILIVGGCGLALTIAPVRVDASELVETPPELINPAKGVVAIRLEAITLQSGRPEPFGAAGSGGIYKLDVEGKKAIIFTNHHLVENTINYRIFFHSEEIIQSRNGIVRLIGSDPINDLALLEVDLSGYKGEIETELSVLEFADSSKVKEGDVAIAFGNAFNLGTGVTKGVVSRPRTYIGGPLGRLGGGPQAQNVRISYINVDTPINPGNSGGPLFNEDGQVIAINTLGLPAYLADNVAFSIPSNVAVRTFERILSGSSHLRCLSGISLQPIPREAFPDVPEDQGVLIRKVLPGSPADKAEIRPGMVVTKIDGEIVYVEHPEQYRNYVRVRELLEELPEPNQTLELEIYVRGSSQPITISMKTESAPPSQSEKKYCSSLYLIASEPTSYDRMNHSFLTNTLGLRLYHLDPEYYDLRNGMETPILTAINIDDKRIPISHWRDLEPHCSKEFSFDRDVWLEVQEPNGSFRYVKFYEKETSLEK